MTREEALIKVKGYLTDYFSSEDYDEVKGIMTVLEQQPCENAISREAVLDEINRVGVKGFETYNDYSQLYDFVDTLPSVIAQPKTGHWNRVADNAGYWAWECDKCGWQQRFNTNYCPDCGAKMEVNADDSN